MATKKTSNTLSPSFNRAPIVTIMGHVDHGKTTLLDALRESKITDKEHGGITQHIGAYQIIHQDQPITFIDTPGHAAFSKMRERGAHVTDIVVLVIAADDGIKPQTVESIKHIKASGSHLIVAINKMDVVGASADMVKAQLTEHEIFVEGYGGQTPVVEISAKTKKGLDQLLEIIVLLSQVEELNADPQAPLEAIIIESNLDKKRGALATAIVKNGTIKVAQHIYTDDQQHKVKALFNDLGQRIEAATPGEPVEILGFKAVPAIGTTLTQEPSAPDVSINTSLDQEISTTETDEDEEEKKVIPIILKADTAGTLEAIMQSIAQEEIVIVSSSVGVISESDILHSQNTNALIIGFNVPVSASAKKLARIEKIEILTFNIIYKLIEYIEKRVMKLLEPTIDEQETGVAQVMAVFEIRGEVIAGCKVISGKIDKGALVHLERDQKNIADAKISSLKQGKIDVNQVEEKAECGIVLSPAIDIKVTDRIKSYIINNED